VGPFNFHSITAAAGTATGADTIEVHALDPTGLAGYSQINTNESYPIALARGVTVRGVGNGPVYIWSDAAVPPTSLFTLAAGSGNKLTTIRGLQFIGGSSAITASASALSQANQALLRECSFRSQRIAVISIATNGAQCEISLRDCLLQEGGVPTTGATAVLESQDAGFQFHAIGSGGSGGSQVPSKVVAEIIELQVSGAFATTGGLTTQGDLAMMGVPTASRIVDIYAQGDNSRKQYDPDPTVSQTIPEVLLTTQGGTWTGGTSFGWDMGIYAEAQGPGLLPYNFHAGWQITMTGTTVKDFALDGFYGMSDRGSRGLLDMNGSTQISNTQGGLIGNLYNGIHLFSGEQGGYVGLLATSSSIAGNAGHGLFAHNSASPVGVNTSGYYLIAPEGIFLQARTCTFEKNGGAGLSVLVGDQEGGNSWVGGTIHQHQTGPGVWDFVLDGSEAFLEPHGQGTLQRNIFDANGQAAIEVRGNGSDGVRSGQPDETPAGVAFRVSSSMIWNHKMGALDATWAPAFGDPNLRKGFYLVPVTQDTMCFNGDATTGKDWTMEIDDQGGVAGAQARCVYEKLDPVSLIKYRTMVYNSILFRDPLNPTSLATDLGPILNSNIPGALYSRIDDNAVTLLDSQIGFAGTRGRGFWGTGSGGGDKMTNSPSVPFIGPLNAGSSNPLQFFLSSGATADYLNATPMYFNTYAPETHFDFAGNSRPGASTGLRDKGADEL